MGVFRLGTIETEDVDTRFIYIIGSHGARSFQVCALWSGAGDLAHRRYPAFQAVFA
jgi:hypothetical protein